MPQVFWEIIIIFALILLNGFFSMSEIALISVRKTRVASLIKHNNSRAKIIDQLHKDPEKLFATVQIGISIVTIFASAFAGSSLAVDLSHILTRSGIGFIAEYSRTISFVVVVAVVSYVSLIIGELVPKSLGLRYAENFSLLSAYPIWWLSKISFGLIKILKLSTNLILKPFRDSTSFTETRLSEEEIRALIEEGQQAGTIESHERSIIENVFESNDLTVDKIMIPRGRMSAFDISNPSEQVVKQSIESGFSRLPVYSGNVNNIVGILYTKKLLHHFGDDFKNTDLQKLLLPPYFVPGSMKINNVLQRLQRKKQHMAMVTDEHGEIAGLVTLEDILEEIVGDISDETDEVSPTGQKQDGSTEVSGEVSIVDFNKQFKSDLPENEDYTTLSGYVLSKLGRFPKEGDKIVNGNIEITIKEKTLRTVKIAIIKKLR